MVLSRMKWAALLISSALCSICLGDVELSPREIIRLAFVPGQSPSISRVTITHPPKHALASVLSRELQHMAYTEDDWARIFCRWFEEHHKTLHREPWFSLHDHHVRFMEFLLDCSPDSDPPINRMDLISELEPLCDRQSIQIVRQSRRIS